MLQPNTIEYDVFPIKNSYALNDVPQLIYTAVIYPQKGQLILVEAVKILIEKHFVLHVDFIGDFMDEGYKSQIEAYIKRYNLDDYISFRGRIENSVLLNLLPSYDIYVSPSLIEMSPFNLLEAKAAGLPVVACKTGGIPDIISDKTDGLLVPPNDVKSLADSIEELLNSENLRERLGKTARYNISNTQTPEVVANKMQDFFYRINSL